MMTINDIQLKKRIMRRVYAIWLLRHMISPAMLKLYALAVFLWQSSQYVSWRQVMINSPAITDMRANYSFATSAFSETELMTQILFVGMVGVLVWFAKDLYRYAAARTRHSGSALHV